MYSDIVYIYTLWHFMRLYVRYFVRLKMYVVILMYCTKFHLNILSGQPSVTCVWHPWQLWSSDWDLRRSFSGRVAGSAAKFKTRSLKPWSISHSLLPSWLRWGWRKMKKDCFVLGLILKILLLVMCLCFGRMQETRREAGMKWRRSGRSRTGGQDSRRRRCRKWNSYKTLSSLKMEEAEDGVGNGIGRGGERRHHRKHRWQRKRGGLATLVVLICTNHKAKRKRNLTKKKNLQNFFYFSFFFLWAGMYWLF